MEKDSLGVLIKDRGIWSHCSKVFLILAQVYRNLVRVVAHCLALTKHCGSQTRANPKKSETNGQPL